MLLALNMNNTHTGTQRSAGCSWPYCIYLKMHMTVLNFVYSLSSQIVVVSLYLIFLMSPKGQDPNSIWKGAVM